MTRYRVIKEITDGFRGGAKVGDVLTVKMDYGFPTLFNGEHAICDLDSPMAKRCTVKILEEDSR